jgi:hypothetical protein
VTLPVALPPVVIKPVAPERYRVQFTINRTTHDTLQRVQDLLRHVLRDGDVAAIFDRALMLLFEDLLKKKTGQAEHPRSAPVLTAKSSHVPRAVRREVWKRDGGQCAFVGASGRCTERGLLEVHHVVPFADDGPPTSVNLQLRCRAHHAYEAQMWFGSGGRARTGRRGQYDDSGAQVEIRRRFLEEFSGNSWRVSCGSHPRPWRRRRSTRSGPSSSDQCFRAITDPARRRERLVSSGIA